MAKSPRGAGENENQDCWKLLSTCEKTLLILLALTLTALLALLIVTAVFLINGSKTCDNPSCIKTSSEILESIDFSHEPCQNFQQFVCGNQFLSNSQDSAFHDIELRKKFLINSSGDLNDSDLILNAKRFYQACSNPILIEQVANITLHRILDEIGGWPLLLGQKWSEDKFNWLTFTGVLRNRAVKSDWLMSLDFYNDGDGMNYLLIGPPDLLKKSEQQQLVYYETMVKIGVKLGSSVDLAWQELRKVSDFENELASISERVRQASKLENPTKVPLENINRFWPHLNLVTIFNTISGGYAKFTKNTTVATHPENFINELNGLLMKTPGRTQANYMVWKVIEYYLPYCHDNLRKDYEIYKNIGSREDFCFGETTKRFGSIIEQEYLNKYVSGEITKDLTKIANMIKDHVLDGEFESRETEVSIMGMNGAYSEIENLEIKSNNILRIVNDINVYVEDQFFGCINKNSTRCIRKTLEQNAREAYFDLTENIVYLPSYLIHSDSYQLSHPNYINYGRLGRIMGDLFLGVLKERNISSCNIDNFNISNGVELAYHGYVHWTNENGMEERLPGLGYVPKELFWISSASVHCMSQLNDSVRFDEITQSQYFQREFGCNE